MRNGTSSKLSAPIKYDGLDFEEQLKDAMNHFFNIFLDKTVKPSYNGKDIFFNMSKESDIFTLTYPERFLHIVSMDDEEKFNMYPCVNDPSYEYCDNRCTGSSEIINFSVLNRWECPYRLSRIHWIREVIDLANNGDPDVTEWEVVEANSRGKYNKRLLRYCCGIDDYLIVFRDHDNRYQFITAYPIVKKSKKEECDNAYSSYMQKLKRLGIE